MDEAGDLVPKWLSGGVQEKKDALYKYLKLL